MDTTAKSQASRRMFLFAAISSLMLMAAPRGCAEVMTPKVSSYPPLPTSGESDAPYGCNELRAAGGEC